MTDSKSSRQFQIGINAVLILVTLMVVLPFLLVFVSSITDENVLIRNGYSFSRKRSVFMPINTSYARGIRSCGRMG